MPLTSASLARRPNPGVVARVHALVGAVAAGVVLVAFVVLGGYALGLPILTTVVPGLRPMSVVSATALSLVGIALMAERRMLPRVSRALSWGVMALALTEVASHAALGEDALGGPLAEALFGFPADLAGRTSLATAFALALLSSAMLVRSAPRHSRASDALAGLAALVSGTAFVGYLYGVDDLYAAVPLAAMALHTAGALFAASLAVIMLDPTRGWASIVVSDLLGGGATRRQLLLVPVIPLAGWVLLHATEAGRFGPNVAMAMLVVLTAATLAALILRDGRTQDALDAERRSRADALAVAKADVDAQLAARMAQLAAETQERLKVEEALRQAQKMEAIGQLTGGVAHDFNNLLTVIRSSVDLLARPDLPEERRRRYVAAISDTVTRAAKLTGQLLAFARRQALRPEVFDAAGAVASAREMIVTLVGSRISVEAEGTAVPLFVDVDPSQFDTALVNMAANARDAMGGEGTLTISVSEARAIPAVRAHPAREGNFVAVSISDTGHGIEPDTLQRIFEPFFTTKGVGQGTGLGLSQVFGFAKQSGGDVHVGSVVGEGTTFTLYLPRAAAVSRRPEPEAEPLVDGHGTRVLVVEDNEDVGTFAVRTLSDLGYVTELAPNASAALSVLEGDSGRFDVVFSDVVMPGMDGIELAQEIRRRHRDLPVVLTSGYSHVLARNGTYGFELLHKPYSVEELSRVLRKAATWQRRARSGEIGREVPSPDTPG